MKLAPENRTVDSCRKDTDYQRHTATGMKNVYLFFYSLLALHFFSPTVGRAQGTAFTYQGQLFDGGAAANGIYDFEFTLYETNAAGGPVAGPVTNATTSVSNGLFTATVDFGPGVFSGVSYWLDVSVRTNGGNVFTEVLPRQPLTPAPYAIMAASASNLLGSLPSAQLSGPIANANLPSNPVFGGTASASAFSGNGSQLTSLNATNLSGTVADARLSTNVDLLNANQTITGTKSFTTNVGFGTASPDRPVAIQAQTNQSEWVSFKDQTGATVWHLNNLNGGVNFSQTSVSDYRLFLATNGNVGIGTGTPQARLDVRGPISANGNITASNGNVMFGTNGLYFGTGSGEPLRIIRGSLRAGGEISSGSGFTVVHEGTGDWEIDFDQSFSDIPAVTATSHAITYFIAALGNQSSCTILTEDTNGNSADVGFDFVAIGRP